MKVKIMVQDDRGQMYEGEAQLVKSGKQKTVAQVSKKKAWYRPGSTAEKIVTLIDEGFFSKPRGIGDIIAELKTKDFHLKSPDLTLPLRNHVRQCFLQRTKNHPVGSVSMKILYVEG